MSSFRALVDSLALDTPEERAAELVLAARDGAPTEDDLAHLATHLARSGESLQAPDSTHAADIPSTGGPSSLSTLLCPLYLRSMGYVVPKIGVPGRPAGGVDVLAQIPGYRADLTSLEAEKLLRETGYVHLLAADSFAPLDAHLFFLRKRLGAVNVPSLAVASLLSKKLVAGVSVVGLDVRVAPHGNFGPSFVGGGLKWPHFGRFEWPRQAG